MAGGEIGELIITCNTSGGRGGYWITGNIGHGTATHTADRRGNALYAGLTRILNAIRIIIAPDKITDGHTSGSANTGINGEVGVARSQRDRARATGGRIRVTIHRIVTTLIGGGQSGARWQISEAHGVDARWQIGEQIVAARVGHLRWHTRNSDTSAVIKRDIHARDTRLARILQTVAVEIVEHQITEARRWYETEIYGEIAATIRRFTGRTWADNIGLTSWLTGGWPKGDGAAADGTGNRRIQAVVVTVNIAIRICFRRAT